MENGRETCNRTFVSEAACTTAKKRATLFRNHRAEKVDVNIQFSNAFINSIKRARLSVTIFRTKDDWDQNSENEILEKYDLRPTFDKEMKVYWTDSMLSFATGTALLDFAFEKFVGALEAKD